MKRRLNVDTLRLGTTAKLTADEARAMAVAEIEADEAEGKTGPLFRYFADDFIRRHGSRWKPATRASNRSAPHQFRLPCQPVLGEHALHVRADHRTLLAARGGGDLAHAHALGKQHRHPAFHPREVEGSRSPGGIDAESSGFFLICLSSPPKLRARQIPRLLIMDHKAKLWSDEYERQRPG